MVSQSDFVVTGVSGPTSAQPGQQISTQVTVCNQGGVGDSTDVEVYLSADATITPNGTQPSPDSFVGGAPVPFLSPGQCSTITMNGPAYAPAPGTEGPYYLGAVVDPRNTRVEAIETNNTNPGNRTGIGNRGDFVVKSVTGPASAQPGQQISTQVQVCNQGTMGDSSDVEVYLSADATITPNGTQPSPDSFVGGAPVPFLNAGQCTTITVNGPAYAPAPGTAGAYYLGAVVDPRNTRIELIENNNTNAGSRTGIGNKSDFIVKSVTGPTSSQPGQQLSAQVQVCNQGTVGDSTDVEVYLSADTTITPNGTQPSPDSFVGGTPVPFLNPGQCTTVTVTGPGYAPAPGTEGPYYLGAVADPRNTRSELIEDNNTNAGSRTGIGNKGDFVVKSVTGPASAQPGQQISAQVQVCNQGTIGDSTDVEVYFSADATITPNGQQPSPDSFVGNAPVPFLNAGQCTTVTVNGPAYAPYPGTEGPYYLGAVADPRNTRLELIEDNNSNPGNRTGIGNRGDFIVTSVTGPASASPGQQLSTQVQVCNQGTMGDSSDVEVYLSADATITPNGTQPSPDSFVGSAPVPYLNPGQCSTITVNGPAYAPAPGTEGPYYLGAVVDPRNTRIELIEDNNSNPGNRTGIGNKGDFIVKSVTGPASASPGQQISTQVQICNQGTMGDSSDVEVYFSADATITPNGQQPSPDFFVGSAPVPYLNPGQCSTITVSGPAYAPAPGTDGAYYLGAVVDPRNTRVELIEDNNSNPGNRTGIGTKGDFIVKSVTGPASATPGQQLSTQVQVCNQGTVGDSTDVEVYLSADATITPNGPQPSPDSFVGSAPVPFLSAGQCATVTVNGPAYAPYPGTEGAYYLGAVADPRNTRVELIEDNNSNPGNRTGIGNKGDFIVKSVTGPASAMPGQQISTQVQVCNQGTLGDSSDVEVYLSLDATITPNGTQPSPDSFVGSAPVPFLSPGQCITLTVNGPAYAPSPGTEGPYYLGAVVDPRNTRVELIEDNNSNPGNRIGIGNKGDFVVRSVTGPASALPGQQISTQVQVCNQGTMGDSSDVEVYLSLDATITPNGTQPSPDSFVGSAPVPYLSPGQCITLTVNGPAYAPSPGTEGPYYLGAVADPRNTRGELIEDNNSNPGNRIGIGNKGDFTITSVTGPSSVRIGQSFVATFTVCNQGQMSDSVDVELYLSADNVIKVPTAPAPPEDTPIGRTGSSFLAPGQCLTQSLTVYASAPTTGSYYLGAAADPYNSRPELIEDNNTKAGTLMSVTP